MDSFLDKEPYEDIRVLILEDNPADAELLQHQLRAAGFIFVPVIVENKETYTQALREFRPDIILSDYDLPSFSGAEALQIKKTLSPETPFILVTGAVGEERAIEILTGGATDYVLKKKLSRLLPAVTRALHESYEHQKRKQAEAERDRLLKELETRVQVRTAALNEQITRRQETEEALRASENRYSDLVKYAPAAVYEVDFLTKRFLTVNDYMCELSGYRRDELLNMDVMDLLDESSKLVFLERVGRMLSGQQPDESVEYKIRVKNGREFMGLLKVRFLADENGNPTRARVVAYDLTERKKMEEALRKSESRFRAIFEQAPLGIALMDTQTSKFLEINPGFCEIMGRSEDEMRKFDFQTLTYPEDLPPSLDFMKQLIEGRIRHFNLEKRYFRSDGALTWVNLTVVAMWGAGEVPLQHIAMVEDINERKRIEEALRESEEKYRLIFESSLDGVLITKPDGSVISANSAARKILGMTEEEITLRGRSGILDTLDPRLGPALEERTLTGKFVGELNFLRKDGTIFPAEVSSVIFRNKKGQVFSSVIFRDITWRKEAERVLKESEKRFREMADAMPQLVWTGTPDGRTDYVNRYYENFSGITKSPDDFWEWVTAVHPDDLPAVMESYRRAVESPIDTHLEYRLKGKDGIYRWYLSRSLAIRDEQGKFIKWIGTVTDVNDLKEAENALKEHTKLLEESNKELESFSYSVSHDLRAPLRAIDGFSRMLLNKEQGLDQETNRKLQVIRENAVKMDRLINDLLYFSRSGRMPISKRKINMDRIVEELWREEISANPDRKIELKKGKLPEACGDEGLLRQVLSNLLSNAVKFSRRKRQAVIEIGGNSGRMEDVFYVKDNGAGFDMNYYDRLFTVFHRLHPESAFEGTGVGLAIVQRIIHRHGGRVWAEGKVGKGATFYFSLPKR